MKIKKDWDLQTTLHYRAPQNVPQGRRKSYFVVDLGLSRDVMKGNGTLTLSIRDVFNTRKYRYETFTSTYTSDGEFQWGSQSAVLSFNYRLNQKKRRDRSGNRGGVASKVEMVSFKRTSNYKIDKLATKTDSNNGSVFLYQRTGQRFP